MLLDPCPFIEQLILGKSYSAKWLLFLKNTPNPHFLFLGLYEPSVYILSGVPNGKFEGFWLQ